MNIIKQLKKIWLLRKKGFDASETKGALAISSGLSNDTGKDEAKVSVRVPSTCLLSDDLPDDNDHLESTKFQISNTIEEKGKIYNRTLEDLERAYEGKGEDEQWFQQQAVLGTEEEGLAAYDKDGNFQCINWFDCQFCPAFNPNHCI